MGEEIWLPIKDSLGKYLVSNYGRVKNSVTGVILTQSRTRKYLYASMWYGNKRVRKQVHILVAREFLENPNNLPQINHKDENPGNNMVENLEWCTASYNSRYGHRNEKMLKTRKKHNGKKAEKRVLCIRGEETRIFKSIMDASRETGVDYSNISKCCRSNHYSKTAGGYIWKYA